LTIGDVRPVEAQDKDEELQASTPLEGPQVTSSTEEQTVEVPRNSPEVPGNAAGTQPLGKSPKVAGSGSSVPQDTENQQIDQQEGAQASTSEPQADENDEDQPLHNLLDHHIPVYINSYNGITPVDNILVSIRRGVTT
jgi:hypothetical protein